MLTNHIERYRKLFHDTALVMWYENPLVCGFISRGFNLFIICSRCVTGRQRTRRSYICYMNT